jgi:hypothetical protein
MAGPEQFGRLSVWGMMKALVERNMGFFITTSSPTNGTSGTYAGFAGTGAVLIDSDDGSMYVNVGTLASPIWQGMLLPASAGSGLGAAGVAKMTYSFASDGGAIGTIIPTSSPTVPVGAIILGGAIDITTQVTSGGAATIALGFGSGAQAAALKAATAVASFTTGTTMTMIPLFTAATYYKLTASAQMSLTVAAFALTAGRFDVNVVYVQGNV